MAFGQASGPPAGARQVEQLAALLERAGYSTFKEARHPYGLSQRQAAGKFTVGEADELIARLEAAEQVQLGGPEVDVVATVAEPSSRTSAPQPQRASPSEARARRAQRKVDVLSAFGDDLLVAELERRGWCCIPPITDLEQT